MTTGSVGADSNRQLSRPRLFQAPEGILDLAELNPPNPNLAGDKGDPVIVSVLVPYGASGEVVAWFGQKSKNFPVADPKWVIQDIPFYKDELASPGQADVYYEYGGARSPSVQVSLIDSGCGVRSLARHTRTLYGTYSAGLVDAWVVPMRRDLRKVDALIRPILGGSPKAGACIDILLQSGGGAFNEVGKITYNGDGWTVDFDQEVLSLDRSDVLALQVPGEADFFNFSVSF
jgi:hypothetical protein